jgi:hypothetical protein
MKTFGANAIAETLERDRAVVVRALRNTQPDALVSGRPQWKLATAHRALERHNQKSDHTRRDEIPGLSQLVDQIEADFQRFDAGFAQLKAEPDLERRRKLDKQLGVGKLIGSLDRRAKEAHAALGEKRGANALIFDHLIGDLISRYLTLLDYWPSDAEMDRLRAEGNARRKSA